MCASLRVPQNPEAIAKARFAASVQESPSGGSDQPLAAEVLVTSAKQSRSCFHFELIAQMAGAGFGPVDFTLGSFGCLRGGHRGACML